jgi:hypothetical protein
LPPGGRDAFPKFVDQERAGGWFGHTGLELVARANS